MDEKPPADDQPDSQDPAADDAWTPLPSRRRLRGRRGGLFGERQGDVPPDGDGDEDGEPQR